MNCICLAKLSFNKHIWSKNEDVFLIYNNAQINLKFNFERQKQILNLSILAEDENNVRKVFITILQYLFIALGSVPNLEYFKINNEDKLYPAYYDCAKKYEDKDSTLFNINDETLNADILSNIDIINKDFPILNSLISLNSKNYEHITEEHRITLLIHCMEGYHRVINKNDSYLKDRLKEIIEDLFVYNDKFDAGIDKFYGDRNSQLFANIRNMYSHFIDKNIENFGNDDYIFAFFILRYAFRLSLAKYLGIQVNEQFIKEYLYILHDWVTKNKGIDELPKSIPYKLNWRKNKG